MYQLTILKAVETLPQWYREGVVYQIFVDRFNNGNADGHVNAPKPNSFIYGQLTTLTIRVMNTGRFYADFYGGTCAVLVLRFHITDRWDNYLSDADLEASSNHRYDTGDYLKIDPVGDLTDLITWSRPYTGPVCD